MNRASTFATLCVCATAIAISAMWSGAGPLNPPAGDVQPTGVSLSEINESLSKLTASPDAPPVAPADDNEVVFLTQLVLGGVPVEGEDTTPFDVPAMEVFGFERSASAPFDEQSGRAQGGRQYEPIVIRKRIDKATPLIQKALSNNEAVSGRLEFFRSDPIGGAMEHYFTVEFTGTIVELRSKMIGSGGPGGPPVLVEDVALTFQTITWTHETGSTEHTDNWSTAI